MAVDVSVGDMYCNAILDCGSFSYQNIRLHYNDYSTWRRFTIKYKLNIIILEWTCWVLLVFLILTLVSQRKDFISIYYIFPKKDRTADLAYVGPLLLPITTVNLYKTYTISYDFIWLLDIYIYIYSLTHIYTFSSNNCLRNWKYFLILKCMWPPKTFVYRCIL